IVTVSADRNLSLWNQAGTEVIRTFTGITNPTGIVLDAWLPNETTLAAIANDGRVRLWNLGTAQLLKVSEGEPTIAASGVANDHLVLTGNLDAEVHVRQLPGGDPVRVFRGHTTSTHSGVAFSPDGHLVLSGGVERSIRLWDRDTGAQIRSFTASPAGTMAAEFSEDGSLVLGTMGLPEPGVRLWSITTGEVARDFRWTASWPTAATLSRDGTRVAAGAQDQRVRVFDVQSGAVTRDLRVTGWPSRLAFAPTRPWLVVGSTDSTVTVLNLENGQTRHEITFNAGAVTALQFTAGSEALLVAWQDGLVRLYDTERFEVQREFVSRSGFLDAAALSPDGATLLTGESFPSFTATLWDVATSKVLRTFTENRWAPAAVAFSRDGRSVLIGSDTVREWSIADLAPRIGVVRLPDRIEVSWNRGTLERATHPLGPWESVPGATSPWTTSTSTSGPQSIELFRIAPALKSMVTPGSRR
ncbi:MAG: hypothetical protein IT580_14880, partial [Verrucomicrobiales bacterium]|nr:hypothetical protein [Verrucomicrobiales bacterium]